MPTTAPAYPPASFTPAGSFDFTKLSNFVAPENTLSRPGFTWHDAPSSFYLPMEYIISQEACERRRPEELEFKRVRDESMTAEIHDAMRTALFMADIFRDEMPEVLRVIQAHGATHFFWLSTIVSGRRGAVAYVKDNTFFTA
jgi:hypothetical protein